MKAIVLGKGFLGKAFEKDGFEVWDKATFEVTRNHLEFPQLDKYDVVINCMGKSNTRWCEEKDNFNDTIFSNGTVPGLLSKYCRSNKIRFVHISTGCLYDSNDYPQKEDGFIVAHCNYVVSKWIGEMSCDPDVDLILRPRLYFGDFKDRNNLIIKLMKFNSYLDELNSYTSVHTIVEATKALLNARQTGIFNVACDGYKSVYDFARCCYFNGGKITEEELHASQNLYLVNNILSLTKLKQFYNPPKLDYEIERCCNELGV
jgi:dTDP-4-dehydrorhamnose reductase